MFVILLKFGLKKRKKERKEEKDRNGLESRSAFPSVLVAANKLRLSTVINAIRIIDRPTEYGRYRGVMALLRRHDGNDVR